MKQYRIIQCVVVMAAKNLANTYKKLSDIEHVLHAPDTYIGSIDPDVMKNWVIENEQMIHKDITWTPGLYKCFDEGIVNARDHYIRMGTQPDEHGVKLIEVNIDQKTGMITIFNDGNGIDVAQHPEHNIWIPEMIFGHLRSSTNYTKDDKRIVGGKNGLGFKLVLIYSVWGQIETVDHKRGLKYTQTFKNNLSVIEKPIVRKCNRKPYTQVSFIPDYARFKMEGLSDDMFALLKRRMYDIAAVTDRSVRVKFNKEVIPIRTFENYVKLYVDNKEYVYEKSTPRWEYAVCLSPFGEFAQISFVNGINTSKGGKHVDFITNKIVRKLVALIEKKKKTTVKSTTIKEQLMIFVNCIVENPSFDSQIKDYMSTPVAQFGSTCTVSDKFIDKLAKLGIMDVALSLSAAKQIDAAKKTDGKKVKTIRGIPKLIDANFAGGSHSEQCTLILCEGDSAKSGIVSGLSKNDRNTIGIYPLKGKLMNVRDASISKITQNTEICDIKKILGLTSDKKMEKNANLRYGKVLFMTDQDLDGSHIKGLGVNMFQSMWPTIAANFLGFMNTPILKAKKGNQELCFYNEAEYETWKQTASTGWKIKYYKGLGTSTATEFKEYFRTKKLVQFVNENDKCTDALDLVFSKSRANDRKEWLGQYDREQVLDTSQDKVSFNNFVHKELIHFSKYDCERSIPNVMDGLKTSQRKILFAALKRKLTQEIKVAQFAGYVSEHTLYHHGEASLNKAIVGMAQDYIGSNNINLLLPGGQFGTRLQGGKDSASERYIFTQLNSITEKIFIHSDTKILNYLEDDGIPVEPDFYVPIIPMVLVNGSRGIGTGFSTEVLSYDPLAIITYLQDKINDTPSNVTFTPYYKGYKGTIEQIEPHKYKFIGCYTKTGKDTIHISELPIGTWTEDYKQHLENLMEGNKKQRQYVKEYNDMSTDTSVDFTVTLTKGTLDELKTEEIEKIFGLSNTKSTNNMHLFDDMQRMRKFNKVEDIIDVYYPVRLHHYELRKQYLLKAIEREVMILKNKARFIEEQCADKLDLRRKSKDTISQLLSTRGYDKLDGDANYQYLINMPMCAVIEENIQKLRKEYCEKQKQLETLQATSTKQMWLTELTELKTEYIEASSKKDESKPKTRKKKTQ